MFAALSVCFSYVYFCTVCALAGTGSFANAGYTAQWVFIVMVNKGVQIPNTKLDWDGRHERTSKAQDLALKRC